MQGKKNTFLYTLILAPFVFSFAFGLDIYIPIVPLMTKVLNTTPTMVQLTLSLFIFVNGFGELLAGPISDHMGRHKTLLLSSLLFSIGGVLSAFSSSIYMLILARIVCALGASGLLVTAFAIVRDQFSGVQSAVMFNFLNSAIGISPTFAPIIGGYLAKSLGWRSVFWFLAVLGSLTIFIALCFIKETLPQNKRRPLSLSIFKDYIKLFTHRIFLFYMLFSGIGVAICFCFFSVSPFIIIKLLHVETQHFGFYFAIFGLVLACGGLLNGWLVTKIGLDNTLKVGTVLLFLGGLSMLLTNLYIGLSLTGFMLTTVIACLGAVFFLGSGAAGAMEPFPDKAGMAAAGLGFGPFAIAAVTGSILMLFPINSSIPYAITLLILAILAFINLCNCPKVH